MVKTIHVLLMSGMCLFASFTLAQESDPFGAGAADPFGKDPFAVPAKGDGKQPAANQKATGASKAPQSKAPQKQAIPTPGERVSAEDRLRAALGQKASLSVIDVPLEDALKLLAESQQIPILADARALEELGISTKVPVTLEVKNISLRSILRLMLHPLDLTYMVKSEVLIITTAEHAKKNRRMGMYTIPETLAPKSDEVIAALTALVEPQAWDQFGGPCTVKAVDHVLVVSATELVHDAVADFVNQLEKACQRRGSGRADPAKQP